MCTLTKSSDQFKALIVDNNLVRGRVFDFEELSQYCHILDVFKVFGRQMTHIKIGEKDIQYRDKAESKLDEILRLISTYCADDGTLKHLDLQYFYGTNIGKRYMYAAIPIFRNIVSLSISETDPSGVHQCADYFCVKGAYNRSINELVERIIGNGLNLNAIRLVRLKVTGRFFFADHLRRNLKDLSIVECNIRVPDGFIDFLNSEPKLMSFNWDSSSLLGMDTATNHSSNIVYELVAKNVPDLKVFRYYQNEFFINERGRGKYVPHFMRPNQQLLKLFGRLEVLGLATMDIECLQMLADLNRIKELQANLPSRNSEINFDFMTKFTNLKSVKFHTHSIGVKDHMNYLSKMPQLTECHVTVRYRFPAYGDLLVKAVKSAENLEILKISPGSQLRTDLYPKLLEARLAHRVDFGKPLCLQLDKSAVGRFIGRLGSVYRPDVIEVQSAKDAYSK